jgi:hypothetical protein
MAFDPAAHRVVLFGGVDDAGALLGDTWAWDGAAWGMLGAVGPSARRGAALAFEPDRGHLILCAGRTSTGDAADAWELVGDAWIPLATTDLTARSGHAMAYDTTRGAMACVGGVAQTGAAPAKMLADLWYLNGLTWQLRSERVAPSPREGSAMIYDTVRGVSVLFGGLATSAFGVTPAPQNDTWEWDGAAWHRRMIGGPPARLGHVMAYDSARAVTVLFGGANGSFFSGEVWEWNSDTWRRRLLPGPPPRSRHAMSYDPVRSRLVLFGGTDEFGPLADTWEYDGTAWTYGGDGDGPSARSDASMTSNARLACSSVRCAAACSCSSRTISVRQRSRSPSRAGTSSPARRALNSPSD